MPIELVLAYDPIPVIRTAELIGSMDEKNVYCREGLGVGLGEVQQRILVIGV